jgi:trigger factor
MQVTETLSQGLKREFKVVLPAEALATRLEGELLEMKAKARINGFRPGKVPVSHLKRLYGRSIMADVVQNAVNEANRKIVEENDLRPAAEPKIDFAGDQTELEKAFEAQGDFAFTVALEVLPKFEIGTFDEIEIERLVADVPETEVEQALSRLGEQNRTYSPKDQDGAVAEQGDKLILDFVGRIAGEPFEGGSGNDIDLILGSGSFIPGFEDQLSGARQGENRSVSVTFPSDYASAQLAGQAAIFDVTVKSIAAPGAITLDDEFAKTYGFEELEKLKESIHKTIEDRYIAVSRSKWKRALLDALDKKYAFELPEGLVAREFENIWRQVEAEQKRSGRSFADEGTTEEAARADYQRIAERRVRLGLVLAEIGEKAGVKVTDEEVTSALVERVRGYPGQEKMVWDFYRKNPQAMAEIRAPLFEEKTVDHIIAQTKVTEKKVTVEELLQALPEEDEKGAVTGAEPETAA